MIGLVTDSNSQIPPEWAQRYGIEVVPLTVTIDGTAYLEHVELDADTFYDRLRDGRPSVATSQPSPGRFQDSYQRLVDAGAEEILSVHIGSALSGTVNAAQLATQAVPVPVHVLDTGTASFAVACCVLEAAEAVSGGATLDEAAAVAERVASSMGNVFVVRALDFARAGGRLASTTATEAPEGAIPVLSLTAGAMQAIGGASSVEEAADVMAAHVRAGGTALRVGVGVADAGAAGLRDALEARLADVPEVDRLVRYRIGPSVGAHTGPGTVGAFFYPGV